MDVSQSADGLRIWSSLDPAALLENLDRVRTQLSPGTGIIAVVKANAYGHGVQRVAPAIADHVDVLAVATVSEATEVRALAPKMPILLLSPCLPSERPHAIDLGTIVTISQHHEIEDYAALGSEQEPVTVILKIDTGMGRIGVMPEDAILAIQAIEASPMLRLHSVATHLPSPDEDPEFTTGQLQRFETLMQQARAEFPEIRLQALNSGGAGGYASWSFDFARIGLALYGISPFPEQQPAFRQALTWQARILQIRDLPAGHGVSYGRTFITPHPMRVATVAAGYADGYPRQASGKGAAVMLHGERRALLGRVTMDHILIDVTGMDSVQIGDPVTLTGPDLPASELATWADTIPWNIFTSIGGRTVAT